MKKIAIVLLAVILCFSLCACSNSVSKEEKEEIIKIVSNTIDTNIEKFKTEKDKDDFCLGYVDINDVTYEVVNVIENETRYVFTIVFKATSTHSHAQYLRRHNFTVDLLEGLSSLRYNGKIIDYYGADSNNGDTYGHVSIWINGEEVDPMGEKKPSSNSSNSSSKCTICGQKATNTFQGSGYCSKHYSDAVKWAINNVAEKD